MSKWKHGTRGISTDEITSYEIRPVGTRSAAPGEIEALCATITQRVNSHDALVEACEAGLNDLRVVIDNGVLKTPPRHLEEAYCNTVRAGIHETIRIMHAALKLAKGEE